MAIVKEFKSFLGAAHFVVDSYKGHCEFTDVPDDEWEELCAGADPEGVTPSIAYTLVGVAIPPGDGTIAVTRIDSKIQHGYIVSHYTRDGDIVRFIGIRS